MERKVYIKTYENGIDIRVNSRVEHQEINGLTRDEAYHLGLMLVSCRKT